MSSFPQGSQGLNTWGLAISWRRSNEEKLHTEKSVRRTNPSFENTKPTTLGRKTIKGYAQDNLLLPSSKRTSFPHQWGALCHRGNIPEGSRANNFPLYWVMASQGNAEPKLIPTTCKPVTWQLLTFKACHSWLSRNNVPLSLRSAYGPWQLLQLCLILVFTQENMQNDEHELVLRPGTPSQFQPPLLLSDLALPLHQRCDNSGREMTKAAGFSLLFAAPSALAVQGTGLGLSPSVYILQSLHNNRW